MNFEWCSAALVYFRGVVFMCHNAARVRDISICEVYVLRTKNSSSPPRTLGGCLCIPLSSVIIMIIIVSRALIELVRAKGNKVLASQSL